MTDAEREAARMASQAQEGRVWVVGEMEFQCNQGCRHAANQAIHVAEQCGYFVSGVMPHMSRFTVSGPNIAGRVVFDWFSSDHKKLRKVEVWGCEQAYVEGSA